MTEKFHEPITAEQVHDLLDYNQLTGKFTARFYSGKTYKSKVYPGKSMGTIGGNGAITITLLGRSYPAHRLAWLWTHGEFPPYLLDHINRDRTDNRIANLRPADRAENGWNANKKKNNTSGVTGVWADKRKGGWCAEIFVRGKKHYLGKYETIEEASTIRRKAELEKFGKFAVDA